VWVGAIAVAQVATGVGLSPALQRAFAELVAAVERFLLKIAVRPASGARLP
jgi:Flp pilus assembly pilin Flp